MSKFYLCVLFSLYSLLVYSNDIIDIQTVGIGKTVNVSCIHQEENESMWIGLDGGGLAYRESPNAVCQFYNKLKGTLPTDVVLCMYADDRGRMWFGSFGDGLFYRDHSRFVVHEGLPEGIDTLQYVSGIVKDAAGTMWIGTTNNGLFAWQNDGTVRKLSIDDGALPTNTVTDLLTYDGRRLFVATGWGLRVIDTQTGDVMSLMTADETPLLEKQLVRCLYQDNDSVLWIGAQTGLYVYHVPTKTYDHLTVADGLAENLVRAICRDQQGCVWVSTERSISRIEVESVHGQSLRYRVLTCHTGDKVMHVRAICCTSDGQMLFGSSGGIISASLVSGIGVNWFGWGAMTAIVVAVCLCVVLWRLYQRERSKRKRKKPSASLPVEPASIEVQSVEEQLIAKATRLVEENMDNTDFLVEDLSLALGMSRSHLYKRFMTAAGVAPQEFIRRLRIKRGKQYLDQSGESVSQVAWRVGMSPKQFAKYFKEEYGVLPSEYMKQRSI